VAPDHKTLKSDFVVMEHLAVNLQKILGQINYTPLQAHDIWYAVEKSFIDTWKKSVQGTTESKGESHTICQMLPSGTFEFNKMPPIDSATLVDAAGCLLTHKLPHQHFVPVHRRVFKQLTTWYSETNSPHAVGVVARDKSGTLDIIWRPVAVTSIMHTTGTGTTLEVAPTNTKTAMPMYIRLTEPGSSVALLTVQNSGLKFSSVSGNTSRCRFWYNFNGSDEWYVMNTQSHLTRNQQSSSSSSSSSWSSSAARDGHSCGPCGTNPIHS
jgi:hypothetical protein